MIRFGQLQCQTILRKQLDAYECISSSNAQRKIEAASRHEVSVRTA